MLIRKVQQPSSFPENKVSSVYTDNASDIYSCEYINKLTLGEVSVDIPVVHTGTTEPTSDIGKNGDIYIMTE